MQPVRAARTHVHHIIAFIREPGSDWLKEAKPGIPFVPAKPKPGDDTDTGKLPSDFLVGYAPGQPPEKFEPGQAKLIRAGSDIILQVHYTTNGKPGKDRSRIGLVFAKQPPARRVFTFLSFVHDDGKGFIGVHSATITFTKVAGVWRTDRRLLRRAPLGNLRRSHPGRERRLPRHGAVGQGLHPERRDLSGEEFLA